MKVKLPNNYIICPHCGAILTESAELVTQDGLYYSRILCGKPITCPSCQKHLTSRAKVIRVLPEYPKIVEVTCSNPECGEHYISNETDRNIIFQCDKCQKTLKYPSRAYPVGRFEIQAVVSDITLNTPLVSLKGLLAVTRMGLFHFIKKIKPGNDESRLGKDGDALYERIKAYIKSDKDTVYEVPSAIQLQIMHRQQGFWSVLERYVDYVRISPSEIGSVFYDKVNSPALEKALRLLNQGIIQTRYGSISFSTDVTNLEKLQKNLSWFVNVSKFYKPEFDSMFFEPRVKYFCECGVVFKAFPSAVGLDAICYSCGRKITFRHRPMSLFQRETNTGIPAPREVTHLKGYDTSKEFKFTICTSCNKWTWIDDDSDVSTPVCRFCKTPVNINGKSSKWIEYSCPYCSQTIVIPEILGGCEAVCKNCGESSIIPLSNTF